MLYLILTTLESVYLLFMYIFYKTNYTFAEAKYDKQTQSLGPLFVHDTGSYENKVCMFGKIMAVIAVCLAYLRLFYLKSQNNKSIIITSVLFNSTCVFLAYMMNFTAFIYLLPLVLSESYFLFIISNASEKKMTGLIN